MSALPFALSLAIEQLIVVVLAWWLCRQFINPDSFLHILDHPNERSLHTTPVPRSGGIAILIAITVGLLMVPFTFTPDVWWMLAAASIVAAVSIADDWFDLSVVLRFGMHFVAAIMLVYGVHAEALPYLPWWLNDLLLIIATVWMLNLYNFMDGMDGFAGGMTLSGFAFMGLAAYLQGAYLFALLSWVVTAASAGFLVKNFPPAKIFMGDTGSATIGFMAAAFSLWGIRDGIFGLWFPLLVFSPFILDATVTLLRRLLRGEKVWQAHREHYYQRLALAGWGHKRTVMAEYVLMLASGVSAMAMLHWEESIPYGLAAWIIVYAMLAYRSEQFCRSAISLTE